MPVTIAMNEAGRVWIETPQGDLLAECFFKAEDETADELRQMGYQALSACYPAAQIAAGRGIAVEDMADLFLARIIHQPEKSIKASTFDVRVAPSPAASQAHHEPKLSP